jgi:hypothetical protein
VLLRVHLCAGNERPRVASSTKLLTSKGCQIRKGGLVLLAIHSSERFGTAVRGLAWLRYSTMPAFGWWMERP